MEKENRLIAEFMELKEGKKYLSPPLEEPEAIGLGMYVSLDEMRYHTSWDWLMPVVEKIESFQDGEDGDSMRGHLYNFRIEQHFVYVIDGGSMDHIIEMDGDSKLQATYQAVVEFIKFYNQNK